MATLANLAQQIMDPFRDGTHISVTKVTRSSASTDVVEVGEGMSTSTNHVAALALDASSTALTIDSVAQQAHPSPGQVTVSGGDAGASYLIVVLHNGNAAGL